ncbi:MAG TPA: alpha/beta hydrolase-fold protein [Acidimicrobiales bacterium]|jgi:S-formylglutathione hydrolase FrmB|nr:alpha/beta hydrolase-fold protein [Acidimicrobiales bacterium]
MSRTDALPDAPPGGDENEDDTGDRWSRRRVLSVGLGSLAGLAVAATVGIELVSHGVVPGKEVLDQLDGACSVGAPPLRFQAPGVSRAGSFFSRARGRQVGYTLAWPPGRHPGDPLPLVVMLHGFGANHTNALTAMSPAQAVALEVAGVPLPPMAMVTVDGGGGYWNPHPGDDPMQMVVGELIPLCQRLNLGRPPQGIGSMGISMGGYGAVLLAEKHPEVFGAVAAISPAIWTTYEQARSANQGAYASAADFASDDAVTHAGALAHTRVRVASGTDDPFHPGVVALARALPSSAVLDFSQGCHTGAFFTAQESPSLAFLGAHLSARTAS